MARTGTSRHMVEESGLGYVVAVPKSRQVTSLAGDWRIDQLVGDAPDKAWERLSCGEGPRVYDWAAAQLPAVLFFDGGEASHRRWVMARRAGVLTVLQRVKLLRRQVRRRPGRHGRRWRGHRQVRAR